MSLLRLVSYSLSFVLVGCALPARQAVLPFHEGDFRPLPRFENVRAIDGFPNAFLQESLDRSFEAFAQTAPAIDGRRPYDMLVLSSGGVNGAFGAGVLCSWTNRGRPDFWFISGVSVGALMCPFVFAGAEYDDRLERLFRGISPEALHEQNSVLGSVLWGESLMDNSPLVEMVESEVDEELLSRVADRHAAGRRLFVGTTNLDSGQFVVWDMGAIASEGSVEALTLFRQVLVASASIPVVYPPQRIKNGKEDELHVDGAVMRPLFIPQNVVDVELSASRAGFGTEDVAATMWVIHNGSLRSTPETVARSTFDIAIRTVLTMSYMSVQVHILNLYILSRVWGARFRFLTMAPELELSVDAFTKEDTDELFEYGFDLLRSGSAWSDAPPGYVVDEEIRQIRPTLPAKPAPDLDPQRD